MSDMRFVIIGIVLVFVGFLTLGGFWQSIPSSYNWVKWIWNMLWIFWR